MSYESPITLIHDIANQIFYDEYGKTWLTSLSDLKKAVLEPNEKLVNIANQINADIENRIYQSILKIGIDVNKEELIKALQYDRNQYEKGYADGRNDAITHAHWEKVADHVFRCSLCNNHRRYASNYCPHCGSKMDEENTI